LNVENPERLKEVEGTKGIKNLLEILTQNLAGGTLKILK